MIKKTTPEVERLRAENAQQVKDLNWYHAERDRYHAMMVKDLNWYNAERDRYHAVNDALVAEVKALRAELKRMRGGEVDTAASELGRRGGSKTSDAKTAAARANGAKGGRPRKKVT